MTRTRGGSAAPEELLTRDDYGLAAPEVVAEGLLHGSRSPALGTESAATVQGQDDLFDDDYSDESDPTLADGDSDGGQVEAAVTEQTVAHHDSDTDEISEDDDVPRMAAPTTPLSADMSGGDLPSASSDLTCDSGYLSQILPARKHDIGDKIHQGPEEFVHDDGREKPVEVMHDDGGHEMHSEAEQDYHDYEKKHLDEAEHDGSHEMQSEAEQGYHDHEKKHLDEAEHDGSHEVHLEAEHDGSHEVHLDVEQNYGGDERGHPDEVEHDDGGHEKHLEEAETRQRTRTPQILPVTPEPGMPDTLSPLSLRPNDSPVTPHRGLSESRHAPAKRPLPVTPPQQTALAQPRDEEEEAFAPRDVTLVPWHARHDSVPASLHSQTTLSSSPPSPVRSSVPTDGHEPAIRDSWTEAAPTPSPDPHLRHMYLSGMSGGGTPGRVRSGSLLQQQPDYDPFKYSPGGGGEGPRNSSNHSPLAARWATRAGDPAAITPPLRRGSVSQRYPVASSPPSSLFQKMRSIFEPPPGGSSMPTPPPSTASPSRSRSASGVWYSPSSSNGNNGRTAGSAADTGYDAPGEKTGGFLNEAENVDERSALLSSSGEADGATNYDNSN